MQISSKTYHGRFRLFFVHHSRRNVVGDFPNQAAVFVPFSAACESTLCPAVGCPCFPFLCLVPQSGGAPRGEFSPCSAFCLLLRDDAPSLALSRSIALLLDAFLPVNVPPAFCDRDDTTAPPGPVRPFRRPIRKLRVINKKNGPFHEETWPLDVCPSIDTACTLPACSKRITRKQPVAYHQITLLCKKNQWLLIYRQ